MIEIRITHKASKRRIEYCRTSRVCKPPCPKATYNSLTGCPLPYLSSLCHCWLLSSFLPSYPLFHAGMVVTTHIPLLSLAHISPYGLAKECLTILPLQEIPEDEVLDKTACERSSSWLPLLSTRTKLCVKHNNNIIPLAF